MSIGKLQKLEKISFANNNLTYLPDEFCNLKSLKSLYLDRNPIGALPINFGKLKSLNRLSIDGTKIIQLPKSMQQIPALKYITVSNDYRKDLNALRSFLIPLTQNTSLTILFGYNSNGSMDRGFSAISLQELYHGKHANKRYI